MPSKTVIRCILLASDKFPLFQINRISVAERKPKDTSGQEPSRVVVEKEQGPKEKAHNKTYSGSVKEDGILRYQREVRFH